MNDIKDCQIAYPHQTRPTPLQGTTFRGLAAASTPSIPPRRHWSDLRGRRHDLGIGVRDMAAGLGIGLARLLTMEDGTATDEDKTFYRTWLSRIEGWPGSQRHTQLQRASAGEQFT